MPTSCPSGYTEYTGTLSGTGDYDKQPNGAYYYSSYGTQSGILDGPAGADFDLWLYKWSGGRWTRWVTSTSSSSHEEIDYMGSGYFYWKIVSHSGSGSYTFCLAHP